MVVLSSSRSYLLALLLAAGSPTHAQEFQGRLYEPGTDRKKLLFTNQGTTTVEGTVQKGRTVFRDPKGVELVVEETVFEKGAFQSFSVTQKQLGESGTVVAKGGALWFSYTRGGVTRTAEEKLPPNLVAGSGIGVHLMKHWDRILRGDEVAVRLVVLDRLETIGFKFFKHKETRINDRDCVVVKMKPTNVFISAMVDPVYFTLTKDGSVLLEIDGRTSPKIKQGDDWKDCRADAVFSR